MLKQIEPAAQTPAELLRYLDVELAAQRQRRSAYSRNRAAILTVAMMLLLLALAGALLVLSRMANDLPRPLAEPQLSAGQMQQR